MRQEAAEQGLLPHTAGELRTLGNALRVIAELADAEEPLALTQLAARLRLAPSTIHRILATLTTQGYAARVPTGRRYRGGPALARLARRALRDRGHLVDIAHAELERLAAASGETSHLSVLDGSDTLGVDLVQGNQPVVAHHPVGSLVPAHATAMGQAMLAHLPELAARMARDELRRFTPQTITDAPEFERVLAEVRARGFAMNVGQLHPETAGVAAPIFDPWGSVIAAIGITGPSSRLRAQRRLRALGMLAHEASVKIGRRLEALTPSVPLAVHEGTAGAVTIGGHSPSGRA